jgi:O-antigen ligase
MYLFKTCIFMGVLWLLLCQIRTAAQVELLARTLVLSGFIQALIGVLLLAEGAHYFLFFVPVEHTKGLGTFVYHNHFAGYMEMTLAIGIGLMIAKLEDQRAGNWKQRAHGWLSLLMGEKVRLRIALIVMVIGLIASHSRMGNSAFFISLLGVGLLAIVFSKKATHSTIMFITSLIVLDVVIVGGVVGIEKVLQRIEATNLRTNAEKPLLSLSSTAAGDVIVNRGGQSAPAGGSTEESVEERIGPGMHALKIVNDFPLLGTGGGTFHLAFFPYRPAEVRGYFDHAHNDFFEFAAEVGLVGMLLLAALVLHSVVHSVRILVRRRSQFARGMAFASLMGVTAMMIHSAVDFNLQNTTNGMLFLIVLGLPYLVARQEQSGRVKVSESQAQSTCAA